MRRITFSRIPTSVSGTRLRHLDLEFSRSEWRAGPPKSDRLVPPQRQSGRLRSGIALLNRALVPEGAVSLFSRLCQHSHAFGLNCGNGGSLPKDIARLLVVR
jgi:hypothetical protein